MKQKTRNLLKEIDDGQIVPILQEYYDKKYPDKEIFVEIEGRSSYDERDDRTDGWVNCYIYEVTLETDQEYSERLKKEKEKEERERKTKILNAQFVADSLKSQYEKKIKEIEMLKNEEADSVNS